MSSAKPTDENTYGELVASGTFSENAPFVFLPSRILPPSPTPGIDADILVGNSQNVKHYKVNKVRKTYEESDTNRGILSTDVTATSLAISSIGERHYLAVCSEYKDDEQTTFRIFEFSAGRFHIVHDVAESPEKNSTVYHCPCAAFIPDTNMVAYCDLTKKCIMVRKIVPGEGTSSNTAFVTSIRIEAKTVAFHKKGLQEYMGVVGTNDVFNLYQIETTHGPEFHVVEKSPLLTLPDVHLVALNPRRRLFVCSVPKSTPYVARFDQIDIQSEVEKRDSDITFDKDESISCVGFDPEGNYIAIGLMSGFAQLWRLTEVIGSQPTKVQDFRHVVSPVTSLAFLPSAHLMAIGNENGVVSVFSTSPARPPFMEPPPGRAYGGLGGSRRRQIRKTKRRKYRNTKRKCRSCRRK